MFEIDDKQYKKIGRHLAQHMAKELVTVQPMPELLKSQEILKTVEEKVADGFRIPRHMLQEEALDRITPEEFKLWLTALVETKRGALPDFNDWKEIKKQLDRMYLGENTMTEEPVYLDQADNPWENGTGVMPEVQGVPTNPIAYFGPSDQVDISEPPMPEEAPYGNGNGSALDYIELRENQKRLA